VPTVRLLFNDKGAKASTEKPLALRDPGDGRASYPPDAHNLTTAPHPDRARS
jgi:hypothetical protein